MKKRYRIKFIFSHFINGYIHNIFLLHKMNDGSYCEIRQYQIKNYFGKNGELISLKLDKPFIYLNE